MRKSTTAALVFYLVALAVGVLTPHPLPNPPDPQAAAQSAQGLVADAIRNLFLLLPLGWLLAAVGRGPLVAARLGLLLSVAIEALQSLIPGRHPSVIDVVTNTASTAAGAWLYATRRQWLTPTPTAAARLALVFFLAACSFLYVGVQLLRLSPGGPEHFIGLRPERGNYEMYAGEILDARIGTRPLLPGRVADEPGFAHALVDDQPLRLLAVLRPSRGDMAPLLTVEDTEQREIFIVGAEADDLLVEWRTRALDLGLDQPSHRWSAALAGPPSSAAAEIRIERAGSTARLSIAGLSLGDRSWTPGRIWSLLIRGRFVPAGLEGILDAVSIALLALPFAYYAQHWLPFSLSFLALLVALPKVGPVAMPHGPEWVGLAGGLLIARLVRWRIVVLTSRSQSRDAYDEKPR
jgi:VanZ family protein